MLLQARAAEALVVFQAQDDLAQGSAGRAMAHHDLGETEEAEAALKDLLTVESMQRERMLAQAYAWMGRNDVAFEWLQMQTEQDLRWAQGSVFNPVFRKLHDDPRWDEWRESIEMSAERLDAIEFNPDLPE